ncbi:MAG: glycoside hydrolase family 3 N-terminal domain-containing protein [Crocinitomicaceae bacterium]|nr:glycoside hydrolase family 3 N-terminal domain-containing protein [Crocinitomicaceae bacterium]
MKRFLSVKYILILPVFLGLYLLASNDVITPEITINEEKEYIVEQVEIDNAWVDETIANMSLRDKIGQFFMVAAYSNRDEDHFAYIDSMIANDKIGGLIFFQGQRSDLVPAIERFQNTSEIPLLIGMDAEWGVQMRLFGEERFPYNYTIGAANNPELTQRLSEMMGQECRELGIHLNFAPVADVNSNADNPVIGFRSYGENPKDVAAHVAACVKGMESQGVLTSIKHFPGHGDTDVDSHLELPTVNNTYAQINAIDFFPFRSGIRAGASTVMIGHLNVPALDNTGTPSSLSKPTIQNYLQGELGFQGLVISDALGMKAVADKYGKTEVVVKAFQAGCDILLFPESVSDAISAIEQKVQSGEIALEEIDYRCKKVLLAKHKSIIKPGSYKTYTSEEISLAKKQLYEQAITVIKNEDDILPISRFDQRIAHVSIGSHVEDLNASMDIISKIDHFHFFTGEEALRRFQAELSDYDLIITSLHPKSVGARNGYGMPKGWQDWLAAIPSEKTHIVAQFGNPYAFKNIDHSNIDALIIGYENHPLTLDRAGQFIMGAFASQGHLPVTINSDFKRGRSLKVEWGGRLKESQPEELGISRLKLSNIDTIVKNSIAAGAFPGCQVLVAIEGKVIYNKAFGHHTYEEAVPVKQDDIYDIASITKIAASTLSLMHLESKGEFSLEGKLGDYLSEELAGSPYANIRLKDMMAHQAGLTPWIPFYTATLMNQQLNPSIYSTAQSDSFPTQVADGLWIKKGYTDVIYTQILKTPLKSRRYKYSDVGYYFVKMIVEKKSGMALNDFVQQSFYTPMGLSNICYNPLDKIDIGRIPPTEVDSIFRKRLIQGYVHDQGAAMMGGVGGHAGVFSNARDLASIMQLFLNKGSYGNYQYIDSDVVTKYTGCQHCPKNRRGAGFDKPTRDRKGGPTTKLVSLESFGHSGFTGTLAWADPEYKVNYIFLSNRVYPDAENWKIVKMNIRTDIQRVIYEALAQAK